MNELNNILKALDKALEDKELQIFMLQLEVERLEKELEIYKGGTHGEQTISI